MIKKTISLSLTPLDIAEEFCQMDSMDQAVFFNCIANITKNWSHDFIWQLQYITDEPTLTNEGRKIMKSIGEYGEKQ